MKKFFSFCTFPRILGKILRIFFSHFSMRSVKTPGTSLAHPNSKPEKKQMRGDFTAAKSADDVVIEYLID